MGLDRSPPRSHSARSVMSRKSEIVPIDRRQGPPLNFEFVPRANDHDEIFVVVDGRRIASCGQPGTPRRGYGCRYPRLHRARQERWRGHRGLLRRQGPAVRGYPPSPAPSGLRAGARFALASLARRRSLHRASLSFRRSPEYFRLGYVELPVVFPRAAVAAAFVGKVSRAPPGMAVQDVPFKRAVRGRCRRT